MAILKGYVLGSSNFDFAAEHAGALASIYLTLAAISLVLALRCLRRVIVPVGQLVQALAAAVIGVLAISLSLILIVAALLTTIQE